MCWRRWTPGDPGSAAPLGPSAAPLGANGLVGDPMSTSELYDPTQVLRVKVSGKVSQAPAPKGVQPQRPSIRKAMPVAGTQPVIPVYLCQDGHTICTLAYGDEVMRCTSVKMGTRYWLVFFARASSVCSIGVMVGKVEAEVALVHLS